jgi:hypothetical protein
MKTTPIIGIYLLAAAFVCAAAEHGKHSHAPPAGIASLDVFANGNTTHLLVAEYAPGADTPTLQHRRSDDAGASWNNPVRVDSPGAKGSIPFRPHRGMEPQVAAQGERLVAAWTTPGTDRFGSGPMATALSSDGGKSWKPGPNPADDGLTTGHGFIDLTADAQGQFHLVWLDSRDGKQGVRHARSADGGRHWSKNTTVKAQSCECCWNIVAADKRGGLHVLFRDQSPRDMALASSTDGGARWQSPVVVGDFDWEFSGCPHVGGGLAVSHAPTGLVLDAIVWSGAVGKSGVSHLRSTDAGRSWSAPYRLCNGDGRRADLAALDSRRLAATWEVVGEDESYVLSAQSADGGKSWSLARRLSAKGASAAYPRVIATPQGFRVFWTETVSGATGQWRMEKLSP